MIKFEKTEVLGWEHAIRGMRNPMNSWEKSDSQFRETFDFDPYDYPGGIKIGSNDLDLMKRLREAGTDHRKFMWILLCMWILLRRCIGGRSLTLTKSVQWLIAAVPCTRLRRRSLSGQILAQNIF